MWTGSQLMLNVFTLNIEPIASHSMMFRWTHFLNMMLLPERAGRRTPNNEFGIRTWKTPWSSGHMNATIHNDFHNGTNGTSPGAWKWLTINWHLIRQLIFYRMNNNQIQVICIKWCGMLDCLTGFICLTYLGWGAAGEGWGWGRPPSPTPNMSNIWDTQEFCKLQREW